MLKKFLNTNSPPCDSFVNIPKFFKRRNLDISLLRGIINIFDYIESDVEIKIDNDLVLITNKSNIYESINLSLYKLSKNNKLELKKYILQWILENFQSYNFQLLNFKENNKINLITGSRKEIVGYIQNSSDVSEFILRLKHRR